MNHQYKPGDIVLGNWKLTQLIGEGSFGRVFEARREDFGAVYKAAVKIITIPQSQAELKSARAEGMDEDSLSTYFRSFAEEIVREFALMSKLKGTANIVSYEDHTVVQHEDGVGWDIIIRMELLTPLLDYSVSNAFTRQKVIQLGIDICRALELCQKFNIIHRDIKPENIFISELDDFKLGDFGIARTVEKTSSGLSKKGTYTYMAPEVYREGTYGPSVDMYSLGIVLYRLLNDNRSPFLPEYPATITHSDREAALAKRLRGEALPPPKHAEGRLAEIVLKACSYQAKDRYSSPLQLRQELEEILYKQPEAPMVYPKGDTIANQPDSYISETLPPVKGVMPENTESVFGERGTIPIQSDAYISETAPPVTGLETKDVQNAFDEGPQEQKEQEESVFTPKVEEKAKAEIFKKHGKLFIGAGFALCLSIVLFLFLRTPSTPPELQAPITPNPPYAQGPEHIETIRPIMIDVGQLSSWAIEPVRSAIEEGLLPESLQSEFASAMRRDELASLVVALYERLHGEITGRTIFEDADDVNVQKAAYIGVMSGIGRDRFAPHRTVPREQAAVIFARLAEVLDNPLPSATATFADNDRISSWALESVGRVQATGIMRAVSSNNFRPQAELTREQGIVALMRVFDLMNNGIVMLPAAPVQEAAVRIDIWDFWTSNFAQIQRLIGEPIAMETMDSWRGHSGIEVVFYEFAYGLFLTVYDNDLVDLVEIDYELGGDRERYHILGVDGTFTQSQVISFLGQAEWIDVNGGYHFSLPESIVGDFRWTTGVGILFDEALQVRRIWLYSTL